nr:hypothetical protein 2 [bacterium]
MAQTQTVLTDLSSGDINELLRQAEAAIKVAGHEQARKHHLEFMRHCWRKGDDDPFIVGYHTRRICEKIDDAVERFRDGESVFLRIAVHNRAGKSDIASRYLAAHFMGEFPGMEVMQVSYSADKAIGFARDGRSIFESEKFRELYPSIRLSKKVSSAREWMIEKDGYDTGGRVFASGLHAGLTGSGYHLGVLDDYCGSRAEAESTVIREKMWQSFTNDFMSRRAPESITIILATQYHWDDIHGRIGRKNDPQDEEYDSNFPRFEYVAFPARREDSEYPEEYPGAFLFLERFPEEWYTEQYSTLGRYAASAIMDCDPILRTGNILNTEKIRRHHSLEDFPKDIKYYRVWDYAHSSKQRTGDDPDYTGGTLIGYRQIGVVDNTPKWEMWIKDYVQFREQAPERDKRIKRIARYEENTILVENSVDSMDGAQYLKSQLIGIRTVVIVNCKGDKVVRCDPIEPIFEAGNVHILVADWNRVWLDAVRRFDGTGKSHDEAIDNMTCAYEHRCKPSKYERLRDPYL